MGNHKQSAEEDHVIWLKAAEELLKMDHGEIVFWTARTNFESQIWSQNGKKKSLKFSQKWKRETSTIPQQLTEQTPSAEEDDWKLRNSYSTDLVLTSVLWRYVVQSHDPRNLGATGNLKNMNWRFWNHETSENLKHLISDKRFSKKNMSIKKTKNRCINISTEDIQLFIKYLLILAFLCFHTNSDTYTRVISRYRPADVSVGLW